REKYTVIEARARALVKQTGMDFSDAFAQVKSELGAETRNKKTQAKLSPEDQMSHWRAQMTPEELASVSREKVKGLANENLLEPEHAKALALDHLFSDRSVARELHAAAALLRRGIGRVTVEQARAFVEDDPTFIRPGRGGKLVTTRAVLAEEQTAIRIALEGRGAYPALGQGNPWEIVSPDVARSEEQSQAVRHVLESTDLATSIRGPAGAGKTTLLRELVPAVETLSGRKVMAFAPSSSAVKVLRNEGFTRAETVQRFMGSETLQDLARGQALLMDEAGFLSARQMRWVLEFAAKNGCRVILAGDWRQHHAVERGDSLRVLENAGAVAQADLKTIFRQRIPELRAAVQALSEGHTEKGFDQLDAHGVVQETEDRSERLAQIARLHLEAVKAGKTSLIVAPTHGECRAIAQAVRESLQAEGLLSREERAVTRLGRINLTESQRRDAISYRTGQVIEFNRRASGGFKSGEKWEVAAVAPDGLRVRRGGQEKLLSFNQAGRFSVYEPEQLRLAAGDQIRLTKNFRQGAEAYRNNEFCTVAAVEEGKITLTDGREIAGERFHVDQGFCVTSHASQGRTVDVLIASVPVNAFAQVNETQLYVTMSRARESMHLFTDCKEALREAVCRPGHRLSPYELMLERQEQRQEQQPDLQERGLRTPAYEPEMAEFEQEEQQAELHPDLDEEDQCRQRQQGRGMGRGL
ncbi:MAG: AAA family ATPase, partial [Verrucomicrobia bacterium]|nr:AAA family ATPase [Verrucomicrobiota bacterium]